MKNDPDQPEDKKQLIIDESLGMPPIEEKEDYWIKAILSLYVLDGQPVPAPDATIDTLKAWLIEGGEKRALAVKRHAKVLELVDRDGLKPPQPESGSSRGPRSSPNWFWRLLLGKKRG